MRESVCIVQIDVRVAFAAIKSKGLIGCGCVHDNADAKQSRRAHDFKLGAIDKVSFHYLQHSET